MSVTRLGIVFLFQVACVRHVPLRHTSLSTHFRDALQSGKPLDPAAVPTAQGRHFLFVSGFLNEGIPGYFKDNLSVVTEELGATASVIYPKSSSSLEEDAAFIRDEVMALISSQHRPVVLVGHSKGGAGVLLTVLRYPELVRGGHVTDVVSIQGALRGSPVADSMVQSLPIPWLHEHFRGLGTLMRSSCDKAFALALPTATSSRWYQDHVFFVRSYELGPMVGLELKVTHTFLERFGPNDGLLLARDQLIEGIGRDLGILRADHGALTVSAPVSGFTADARRAFTRALLLEIFGPH